MKRSILSVIGALAGTALLFGTSACSSTASAEPAPVPTTQTAGAFPRTIVVDGADMTIAEQPQRVLAISSDVADVALQLIGPERMIAVPQYIHSEFTSTQSKLAVQVENALSSSTGADPEQFLALDPDLVLVTTRHTSEEDAFSMLEQAGIPTVAVHNGWDSPDLYRENVRLLGDVLGAEDEAQQLIEQFDARTQAVTDAVASLSDEEKPLTIVLRYLGANPYLSGPGSISYTTLLAAGARSGTDVLGMEKTGQASTEQLISAAPTHLVLLDSSGEGIAQFAEILDHPGMQAVPAVAQDNILILPSATLSTGSGALHGLEAIASWLHPELISAGTGR